MRRTLPGPTRIVRQGLLSTLYKRPACMVQSSASFSSQYEPSRAARPDEVNYALIQNMGEGFHRRVVKVRVIRLIVMDGLGGGGGGYSPWRILMGCARGRGVTPTQN